MALHFSEDATIRAFVVASKRERLLDSLGSAKRRRKATGSLNHFEGWDTRYAHNVPPSADALRALIEAGASADCHIISDNAALDGRDMPLNEAVADAESFPFASILCCLPGRLAMYFDEADTPRTRILLRR